MTKQEIEEQLESVTAQLADSLERESQLKQQLEKAFETISELQTLTEEKAKAVSGKYAKFKFGKDAYEVLHGIKKNVDGVFHTYTAAQIAETPALYEALVSQKSSAIRKIEK